MDQRVVIVILLGSVYAVGLVLSMRYPAWQPVITAALLAGTVGLLYLIKGKQPPEA